MICLTCHRPTPGALCSACAGTLRPSSDRILPGGIEVISAYEHSGAARQLVHLMKYRAVPVVAEILAASVSKRIPDQIPLVPVPRAVSRRLRYGVDPAVELASAVSRRTGAPVSRALSGPLHSARRAGHNEERSVGRYVLRSSAQSPVILVDDVVTSGATLNAAVRAVGPDRVALAVCATSTPGMSSLPVA